ncbi:nucleotidyltransferase domain-containing protein [Dethiosulfatarculus sandiegensis]|uniref:Nucleotidyltransferase n=1 Tax=Dethiosulfatarculus sandiegensis TaxID=1429043 RepID=A0A0D2JYI8_9BACT|nr:nucleotidyltransferase family protein [Dethiosulfatarculus sandiegensis]KIX14600.1 hypothetical protein X474_07480 [Dethiosulfatarculus sandiegensis]
MTDISGLVAFAKAHGIEPFLRHKLKGIPISGDFSGHDRLLARVTHQARIDKLQKQLKAILHCLKQGGIETLVFRGPALANRHYKNAYLRSYADLDLLVRPEQVDFALSLLISDGFTYYFPKKREVVEPIERRKGVFTLLRGDLVLDLHIKPLTGPFSPFSDVEPFFSRKVECGIAGRTCHTLSDEDCLLMLACHGPQHYWQKLRHLMDIHFLLKSNPNLDWLYTIDQAQKLRVEKALFLALNLLAQTLGTDARDQYQNAGGGTYRIQNSCRFIINQVLLADPGKAPLLTALRVRLASCQNRRQMAQVFGEKVFSPMPADILFTNLRLPRSLYGGVRLLRLMGK